MGKRVTVGNNKVSMKRSQTIYARLYELATLLDAGMPLESALRSLKLPKANKQSINKVFSALRKKQPLSQALGHLLPLSKTDQIKLDIAHHSGQLSQVIRELSAHYQARDSRLKQLKAKLWLSIGTIVVATVAGTMKKSVQAPDTIISHLLVAVLVLGVVAGLTKLLFIGVQRDTAFWLNLTWKLGLPRHGKNLNSAFEYFFFSTVFWQVAAGVDIQSAVNKMKNLIRHDDYNAQVEECQQMFGQGLSMTDAFIHTDLARSHHLRQTLNTAEQSGSYQQSLSSFLTLQKQDLELFLQHLYQWIPRVYYAIAIIIGFSMVL